MLSQRPPRIGRHSPVFRTFIPSDERKPTFQFEFHRWLFKYRENTPAYRVSQKQPPRIGQRSPVFRTHTQSTERKTDVRVRDPPMVPQVQVEQTSAPRVVPVSTAKSDALPSIPHVHPVPLAKTDIRERRLTEPVQIQVEDTGTPRVVPVSTAKSDALPSIPYMHPAPLSENRHSRTKSSDGCSDPG